MYTGSLIQVCLQEGIGTRTAKRIARTGVQAIDLATYPINKGLNWAQRKWANLRNTAPIQKMEDKSLNTKTNAITPYLKAAGGLVGNVVAAPFGIRPFSPIETLKKASQEKRLLNKLKDQGLLDEYKQYLKEKQEKELKQRNSHTHADDRFVDRQRARISEYLDDMKYMGDSKKIGKNWWREN